MCMCSFSPASAKITRVAAGSQKFPGLLHSRGRRIHRVYTAARRRRRLSWLNVLTRAAIDRGTRHEAVRYSSRYVEPVQPDPNISQRDMAVNAFANDTTHFTHTYLATAVFLLNYSAAGELSRDGADCRWQTAEISPRRSDPTPSTGHRLQ